MKYRLPFIALTFALLLTSAANAATPVQAPVELADPYDIELILFSRPGDNSGERWPQTPESPDLSQAIAPLKVTENGPLFPVDQGAPELDGAAYTLRRRGMNVMLHQRWRQAIKDRDAPTWLLVDRPSLHGLIRVTKGRYLHIETDLLLEQPGSAQTWRVQLHRRMRSGEMHYLDHPKLGALIIANRVEPADPTLPEEAPLATPPGQMPDQTPDPEAAPPVPGNGLPRSLPDPT